MRHTVTSFSLIVDDVGCHDRPPVELRKLVFEFGERFGKARLEIVDTFFEQDLLILNRLVQSILLSQQMLFKHLNLGTPSPSPHCNRNHNNQKCDKGSESNDQLPNIFSGSFGS